MMPWLRASAMLQGATVFLAAPRCRPGFFFPTRSHRVVELDPFRMHALRHITNYDEYTSAA